MTLRARVNDVRTCILSSEEVNILLTKQSASGLHGRSVERERNLDRSIETPINGYQI